MKKQKGIDWQIENEEMYIRFLKKQLDSENYKNAVSKEEYEKTKQKYDKAKFKLRMLQFDKETGKKR